MNNMKHNMTHSLQKSHLSLNHCLRTGHGDLLLSGQRDPESYEIQMLLVVHNKTLWELYVWCIPFILHP